jgi:Ca2+-binding EF-hand superfamily protein
MFKNGHSSETAFEMFLKRVDKILQKKLTRAEFHRVMNMFEFRFTAPEVDALFKLLDMNEDGELDIEEWKARIYEDSLNPL